MKKAKVMLVAIAVLGTVGGALAFKVKKNGSSKYCFLETTTQPADGGCINGQSKVDVDPNATGNKVYYTTTTNINNCSSASTLACPNEAKLPFNN